MSDVARPERRDSCVRPITVLAHDVRNLLYPVDLAMHVVQGRAERDTRPDDLRDTTKARAGLARLSATVNDILDVARVEQGLLTLELRPMAFVAFVEEIAAMLSTTDHAVRVAAAEEVHALVDPGRLRQAIENIVTNAVKHSPDGIPVDVTVERRTGVPDNVVTIAIIDRGSGVSAELAPHVFDRFVTGPSGSVGLGLGLFLARHIALAHRGDLVVESTGGTGARFVSTLPCGDEAA